MRKTIHDRRNSKERVIRYIARSSRVLVTSISLVSVILLFVGCVETSIQEAPYYVYPDTPFQVIVEATNLETSGTGIVGSVAILIPFEWTVESVYGEGFGYSGPLTEDFIWTEIIANYNPAPGYSWHCYFTPDTLDGTFIDTAYCTVTIIPNATQSIYDMAFLAARMVWVMGSPAAHFEGAPCSTTVEVVGLNLEQATWGSVKLQLGVQ